MIEGGLQCLAGEARREIGSSRSNRGEADAEKG